MIPAPPPGAERFSQQTAQQAVRLLQQIGVPAEIHEDGEQLAVRVLVTHAEAAAELIRTIGREATIWQTNR